MNSPLTIFNNMLPQEVLDQIQQYLPVNENIRTALYKISKFKSILSLVNG